MPQSVNDIIADHNAVVTFFAKKLQSIQFGYESKIVNPMREVVRQAGGDHDGRVKRVHDQLMYAEDVLRPYQRGYKGMWRAADKLVLRAQQRGAPAVLREYAEKIRGWKDDIDRNVDTFDMIMALADDWLKLNDFRDTHLRAAQEYSRRMRDLQSEMEDEYILEEIEE